MLVLRYYSFENYFLKPKIMEKLGIVGSEEEFYRFCTKNGENTFTGWHGKKLVE